jgi:hypothetical protein
MYTPKPLPSQVHMQANQLYTRDLLLYPNFYIIHINARNIILTEYYVLLN